MLEDPFEEALNICECTPGLYWENTVYGLGFRVYENIRDCLGLRSCGPNPGGLKA